MRILFLSRWFPSPPSNGSKLRVLKLLGGLAQRHDVTLLAFADEPGADPDAPELRSLCREVVAVPWRSYDSSSAKARLGLLSPAPRSLVDTYSTEMARCIRARLAAGSYDLVIASQLGAAIYVDSFAGRPAVFEEVEVGGLRDRYARATTLRQRLRSGLTWAKHRRYLAGLLRAYRGCTVVSERERDLLSGVASAAPIAVIPNCVDLSDYATDDADEADAPRPGTLVFSGSFRYHANHQAMSWFTKEVFPLVRAACPDARLTITGDPAGETLADLDNVTIAGFLDDVRPTVRRSWLSVAPILEGGGTRLKILEAMALRSPVVATTKGAEGLDARSGEHLLIADTPAEFAAAVVRVLRSPELRRALADNAYELVRARYDWAAVMPRFLDLVERVGRSTS